MKRCMSTPSFFPIKSLDCWLEVHYRLGGGRRVFSAIFLAYFCFLKTSIEGTLLGDPKDKCAQISRGDKRKEESWELHFFVILRVTCIHQGL
jgi:hypothetical protein